MTFKPPVQSKILITSIPTSVVYLGDALHGFLSSGGLDNLCAQRSALAGGLFALISIFRFYSDSSIRKPKEGAPDDRSNTQTPD